MFKPGDVVISSGHIKTKVVSGNRLMDQHGFYWNEDNRPRLNTKYIIRKVNGDSIYLNEFLGSFNSQRFELAIRYLNGSLNSGGNL